MDEKEFMRQLRETFQVEAEEHLQILSDAFFEIEKTDIKNIDKELINDIFRVAHSLKGASRAVNHLVIQDICQSLETVLSELRKNTITLTPKSCDVFHRTVDLIRKYVPEQGEASEEQLKEICSLIEKLEEIAKGKDPSDEDLTQKESKETSGWTHGSVTNTTIRVSTIKLDKLLQQIEEMLTLKITSGQRMYATEELLKEFEKWNIQKRRIQKDIQQLKQLTIKQSEHSFRGYINALNSLLVFLNWQEDHLKDVHDKIVKLTKDSSQDHRISGSIVDNLFEGTKEVLMQPCHTLFDSYPRVVRDISKSLDKKIKLDIQGTEIEIDRRILEEMKDPLMHLIRNSIDHGIESSEERKRLDKPESGKIVMSVKKISGSKVEISIADDGAGIDIEKVKGAALKNGTILSKDLENMSDEKALMLVFHSGVSTSDIVTDISGRGIGMEVVGEKVEKLGGKIYIYTEKNVGTEFRIQLPLSLAIFRGVHLLEQGQEFVIPTHYLLRVLRIARDEIHTIEGQDSIYFDGKYISYVRLSDVLDIEKINSQNSETSNIYVIVIKALETTLAIGVDKIFNEQEIFVKGLGNQLVRVKNIADATVMEWGKVVPILDPSDIIKTVLLGVKSSSSRGVIASKSTKDVKRTILVAEDTVTARMLLKNILDASGYTVKTAIDGVEAFSLLSQEKIDLLLSDIEMPRMTGFELVEKVRATEKLKDLPIVLCTSLCSKEEIEHGASIGADAYIVKNNFEQSNLLETIEKLL